MHALQFVWSSGPEHNAWSPFQEACNAGRDCSFARLHQDRASAVGCAKTSKSRLALLPFDECYEAYKVHRYHQRDDIAASIRSQSDPVPMMKSSLDHIPHRKQRELARALEILHEEFEDALNEAQPTSRSADSILKIILFGSYARGTFVDEPHTMKGYRSDFDLLVIVNNRKLTDHATYWYKAADRIIRDSFIETPTQFIVHSLREVNTELKKGHYFFSDIRKEGIVLYELDDEPLAEPKPLNAEERYSSRKGAFRSKVPCGSEFSQMAGLAADEGSLKTLRSSFTRRLSRPIPASY